VKGSFLRRNGSFGGRSKITHTLTSGDYVAQSSCHLAVGRVSEEIFKCEHELGLLWLKSTDC
jgi:hypothetical protein